MTINFSDKKLIMSLIKSDLINYKLVDGLNDLGLNAINYHLYLSEFIFDLMEFSDNEQNEETFEYYLKRVKEAKFISINDDHTVLEILALDIYKELNLRKA